MPEETSKDWIKFNKLHKDSGSTIEVDGTKMYQWSCSCGASKLIKLNSGIPLGLKVQWRNHFDELKKQGLI